jgi:hypothetical protein
MLLVLASIYCLFLLWPPYLFLYFQYINALTTLKTLLSTVVTHNTVGKQAGDKNGTAIKKIKIEEQKRNAIKKRKALIVAINLNPPSFFSFILSFSSLPNCKFLSCNK